MKKELVLNASHLFVKYGYAGTSLQMIADTCEISKSALYHYFESKEALLLYALEEQVTEILRFLDQRYCGVLELCFDSFIEFFNPYFENGLRYCLPTKIRTEINIRAKDITKNIGFTKEVYRLCTKLDDGLIEFYGCHLNKYITYDKGKPERKVNLVCCFVHSFHGAISSCIFLDNNAALHNFKTQMLNLTLGDSYASVK